MGLQKKSANSGQSEEQMLQKTGTGRMLRSNTVRSGEKVGED